MPSFVDTNRPALQTAGPGIAIQVRFDPVDAMHPSENAHMAIAAHECGFADASHFSRHVRTTFGATPKTVRDTAIAAGSTGIAAASAAGTPAGSNV